MATASQLAEDLRAVETLLGATDRIRLNRRVGKRGPPSNHSPIPHRRTLSDPRHNSWS